MEVLLSGVAAEIAYLCQAQSETASQHPVSASNPSDPLDPRQPARNRLRTVVILNRHPKRQYAFRQWRSPIKNRSFVRGPGFKNVCMRPNQPQSANFP
jgi:hypothetical protein